MLRRAATRSREHENIPPLPRFRTLPEWESYKSRTRRQILQLIGVDDILANHRLKVIRKGTLDRDGYTIEKNKPDVVVFPTSTEQVAAIVKACIAADVPFLPRGAETIYRSFNFAQPWESVRYEDAAAHPAPAQDLRVVAKLEGNKVKPLFPPLG